MMRQLCVQKQHRSSHGYHKSYNTEGLLGTTDIHGLESTPLLISFNVGLGSSLCSPPAIKKMLDESCREISCDEDNYSHLVRTGWSEAKKRLVCKGDFPSSSTYKRRKSLLSFGQILLRTNFSKKCIWTQSVFTIQQYFVKAIHGG